MANLLENYQQFRMEFEIDIVREYNETLSINQFEGVINGFQCVIKRNQNLLCLMGYVYISENNLLYRQTDFNSPANKIECHGGITINMFKEKKHIIGFDCCHRGDRSLISKGEYRNIEFVKNELKLITEQLKAFEFIKEIKAKKNILNKVKILLDF